MSSPAIGPSLSSPRRVPTWLHLVTHRAVQLAIVGWIVANLLVRLVPQGTLPFDRPVLEGASLGAQLIGANVGMIEVLVLIALVVWLTRNRTVPDIVARLPATTDAWRETAFVLAYGALALLGGVALGQALGMHPIGFHLAGSVFGQHSHDLVSRTEAFTWAGYNLIAYAVVPFIVFRWRSSGEEMLLRSSDRRNDRLVILTVLAAESLWQVAALSAAIFDLSPRQLLLGAPLTLGLYGIGTVLPTMIFIYYSILVPRYLAITRSVPATVILGGLTYTAMHAPDAWLVLTSPGNAVLSLAFLIFVYLGPGMIKAVLTLRTGNAWVHVWAYHAFAPHTLVDTPLMVRIFGIR